MATNEMVKYDDAARRFSDLVRLNGLGQRLITRSEERRLLEEGVTKFNLTLDEARGAMRAVAQDNDYVFESETGRQIRQVMNRQAGRKGKISRAQFRRMVLILRDISESAVTEAEARRQIKRIMVEEGWRPRRAGLLRTRRWYRQIEV